MNFKDLPCQSICFVKIIGLDSAIIVINDAALLSSLVQFQENSAEVQGIFNLKYLASDVTIKSF